MHAPAAMPLRTESEGLPFVTQNRTLALCLHFAGAPIIDVENRYTREQLERWGFPGDVRTAALAAVRRGKVGTVYYVIEQVPNLRQLIETFEEVEEDVRTNSVREIEVTPRDVIRLGYMMARVRHQAGELIEDPAKIKIVERIGQVTEQVTNQATGERLVTLPGVKLISANASDKTKERVGL